MRWNLQWIFWLGYEVGIELLNEDAFSNFIVQIYIVRVSKNIFSRLGLKLEFYFKDGFELGIDRI